MIRKEWFNTLAVALLACDISAETEDEKDLMRQIKEISEETGDIKDHINK